MACIHIQGVKTTNLRYCYHEMMKETHANLLGRALLCFSGRYVHETIEMQLVA